MPHRCEMNRFIRTLVYLITYLWSQFKALLWAHSHLTVTGGISITHILCRFREGFHNLNQNWVNVTQTDEMLGIELFVHLVPVELIPNVRKVMIATADVVFIIST